METLGWNPLLDERSHHSSSMMFPGFGNNSGNQQRPGPITQRAAPQTTNYPRRSSVKFSFNLSEFGDSEIDSLLPLPSPAVSISPGVFFDDPFNFSAAPTSAGLPAGDNSAQRSPSLGIGSSLAGEVNDSEVNGYRPSSVAHFQFPKAASEWQSVTETRARSAIPPPISRPGSSAEWRDDDLNDTPVDGEDLEHWKDWNIKTAPGCPPLDQLFDNKRRWREKFNQSVPPPLQRHCVFCKSINKPQSIYLSHAIRDANGEITCPVLNAYSCPKCGKRGHTIRYCAVHQNRNSSTSANAPIQKPNRGIGFSQRLSSAGSFSDASAFADRSTKSSLGFY